MQRIKNIISLCLIAAALSSCQKDVEYFLPDPGQAAGADTVWQATISSAMPVSALRNSLVLPLNVDSVELTANNSSFLTLRGLQGTIPAGSLTTANGQVATGRIIVQSLLLKTKGDFIRMRTPSQAANRTLISGGAIYLNFRKDSADLQLLQGKRINLKFNTTPVSSVLKIFNGEETAAAISWNVNSDTANNKVAVTSTSYEILTNHLRWINAAQFYDTALLSQTSLVTKLPSNYTNANTMVYLAFNDVNAVVALNAEPSLRRFSSGPVPVNKAVTIIVMSKQGNDYYFAQQAAVTVPLGASTLPQLVNITPVKTPLTTIINYLNSL
ncbi:MAG: hypothetical protein JWQ27_2480 [Ferruginibacter sp.]|nr:hypothetical protein [Ferruginibacter sp.]